MLKVGGVPEHFNLPWRRVLAERADVWIDFPGGSGAMARALGEASIDVAIMLTEAAVRAIGSGLDARIVGTHVTSPLRWGIHRRAGGTAELGPDARFAISRFGSGSHLIPSVLAHQRGWAVDALNFVEVGTVAGARDALVAGRADLFFWEQFMTQPLVDAGDFERVEVFLPPWPSFVAVRRAGAPGEPTDVSDIIGAVGEVCVAMQSDVDGTVTEVSRRFGISAEHAREWLELTDWTCESVASRHALVSTSAELEAAFGESMPAPEELVDLEVCELDD